MFAILQSLGVIGALLFVPLLIISIYIARAIKKYERAGLKTSKVSVPKTGKEDDNKSKWFVP